MIQSQLPQWILLDDVRIAAGIKSIITLLMSRLIPAFSIWCKQRSHHALGLLRSQFGQSIGKKKNACVCVCVCILTDLERGESCKTANNYHDISKRECLPALRAYFCDIA